MKCIRKFNNLFNNETFFGQCVCCLVLIKAFGSIRNEILDFIFRHSHPFHFWCVHFVAFWNKFSLFASLALQIELIRNSFLACPELIGFCGRLQVNFILCFSLTHPDRKENFVFKAFVRTEFLHIADYRTSPFYSTDLFLEFPLLSKRSKLTLIQINFQCLLNVVMLIVHWIGVSLFCFNRRRRKSF